VANQLPVVFEGATTLHEQAETALPSSPQLAPALLKTDSPLLCVFSGCSAPLRWPWSSQRPSSAPRAEKLGQSAWHTV